MFEWGSAALPMTLLLTQQNTKFYAALIIDGILLEPSGVAS